MHGKLTGFLPHHLERQAIYDWVSTLEAMAPD